MNQPSSLDLSPDKSERFKKVCLKSKFKATAKKNSINQDLKRNILIISTLLRKRKNLIN